MNHLPKFKVFVKAENKIYKNISYLGFDYTRNEIEAKIGKFSHNDNDNILLPYWRTIQTKNGAVELYQGDILQIDTDRYIVRYNHQENMFMIADVDDLKKESIRNHWLFFDSDWWNKKQSMISYLGNENTNPELLEEK